MKESAKEKTTEAGTEDKDIIEEIFHDNHKCILTEDDKRKLGDLTAEAVLRKTEAEADLKSFAAGKKADIAAQDAIIVSNSNTMRSGYEYRRVECKRVKNYKTGLVTVWRTDTGETVSERKMSYEERQRSLPLGAPGNGHGAEQATTGMQSI